MKKVLTFILILFTLLIALPFQNASAKGATVDAFRYKTRNDASVPFVRLAMDLSSNVNAEAAIDDNGTKLALVLKNTKLSDWINSSYTINRSIVPSVTFREKGKDVILSATLTNSHKIGNNDIKIFGLKADPSIDKPDRLVIDIPSANAGTAAGSNSSNTGTVYSSDPTISQTPVDFTISNAAKKALKGKVITLDAGHGGTDVGAIGHLNGKEYYEKNITLSIVKPLAEMLHQAGAKVILTRNSDVNVNKPYSDSVSELQARCDIANNAHSDIFVCIHIDSFKNGSVDGTTAYYYPKTNNDMLLARMIHQANMNDLSMPDRGIVSNHFYVNLHTNMPSVLVELGYISNTHRLQMLTSSWGPKVIARSVFNGIVSYFQAV